MSTGSKYLVADGVIGVSAKPVRVHSLTAVSGATAGKIVLRNGSSASGTVYVNELCATVSQSHSLNFEGGLVFPDGCFFDKDANVDSIVVGYTQVGS